VAFFYAQTPRHLFSVAICLPLGPLIYHTTPLMEAAEGPGRFFFPKICSMKRILAIGMLGIVAVAAVLWAVLLQQQQDGLWQRYAEQERAILQLQQQRDYYRQQWKACTTQHPQPPSPLVDIK